MFKIFRQKDYQDRSKIIRRFRDRLNRRLSELRDADNDAESQQDTTPPRVCHMVDFKTTETRRWQ